MSDKVKNSPDVGPKKNPDDIKDSVFRYLEQLRASFESHPEILQKNPDILRQLDNIAKKLKKVSDSVLFIVSGMIRSQLEQLRVDNNDISSRATIMAAKNTEKVDLTA